MADRYAQVDSLDAIPTSPQKNIILHPGDNIFINVFGPNLSDLGLFTKNSGNAIEGGAFAEGYIIDPNGEINFPVTGKVKIAGLSLEMAQKVIQDKVNEYVINAVVDIRLLNYNITILGEVNKPGTYSFIDNRTNLLDALGKAGDCNTYADKRSVMVIRKDGNKTFTATVDILNSGFITDPYFWLQPNDIVYIKPMRAKMLYVNSPMINVVMSTITTLSTILLYTAYLNR
jgi:polysaccharide biosynthesis/export protein